MVDVAPSRQEIERRIAKVAAGRLRRLVMILSLDGAYVPTRPASARIPSEGRRGKRARRARWRGPWRAAKGMRFSLLDGEGIVHVLSWCQVQNEEPLGEALQQIKQAGLIPEEQVRLCVVCDGAEWIGRHVQTLCPQARQVLDYYHCAQYLHRVAKAQYGASVQAVEWVEATLPRLCLGKVNIVLGGLQRMQAQSDEAQKALANCWDYLYEHRGRTTYQKLRRGGYPLGRGGIESSNKFICHVRLKRSGAWWYEANSNHMLALRCAKYHGTLMATLRLDPLNLGNGSYVVSVALYKTLDVYLHESPTVYDWIDRSFEFQVVGTPPAINSVFLHPSEWKIQ